MSYVALATNDFDATARFFSEELGFPTVAEWDRPSGRGRRVDAGGGLRLEILDNARERQPAELGSPAGLVHVVIEVDDIIAAGSRIGVDASRVQATSWGAHLFQLSAPDGVSVTFLQWTGGSGEQA